MHLDAALEELGGVLGDRLSLSGPDRVAHGRSETRFRDMPPDAVVYPRNTDEVAAIIRACARHKVPVIGWGTGTSIEGSALAPAGGVSVDFSLMNKVLQIQPEDMCVTVQPGLTREALNAELRHTGLFFPVDPGANASLGGMASTRASGTTTVRYGTMREQVLGLEVVMADGRVIRTGSRARKSAAGYDLTHMFVGAEGTLGLITELTLKLHGQPETIAAAACAFDDMERAVEVVQATIQMGLPVARIEFLDSDSVAACNAYGGSDYPVCPHLFVEFHGSQAAVTADVATFAEIEAGQEDGFEDMAMPEIDLDELGGAEMADFDFSGGNDIALPDLGGFGGADEDPVSRLRGLIEDRREETLEVLRGWMDEEREKTG